MKKYFHTVTIYTSGSKFCNLTKEYFDKAAVEYNEIDVRSNSDMAATIQAKSGSKETPIVEIDERLIIGYRPEIFDVVLNKGYGQSDDQVI